ncbi:MAG: hypothetical protein ABQ298_14975 [Puniceicoccaceae bacterium]
MNRNVTDPQPLLFFCWLSLGMASLLGSILMLLMQPELLIGHAAMAPPVVAWTHLVMLGWLGSLFFAAGYQLTPVVTLNPLASRWMSRIHFALHLIGVPVMVVAFETGRYAWLAASGSAVILGFVLFAINALLSAGPSSRWNHVSLPWFAAIFWMLAGALLALMAVFMRLGWMESGNFQNVLGLHIHTMIGGFFLQLLIAAASKLVPMFMLSPEKPQHGTWIATILLNGVLFGAHFRMGEHSPLQRQMLMIGALLALLAYGGQLIYFARKKRRRWDAGMTLFYAAHLILLPAWWYGYQFHLESNGASNPDLLRYSVFLTSLLVFTGCILGMAQKIVPFMLWHHLYSQYLGRAKVPQTLELLSAWTLWPIAWCWGVASLMFLLAFALHSMLLIQLGAAALLTAFALMLCNAPTIRSHWRSPKISPFGAS